MHSASPPTGQGLLLPVQRHPANRPLPLKTASHLTIGDAGFRAFQAAGRPQR